MKLGIIGGSGLYELEGLEHIEEVEVATPFGQTSDNYIKASLHGHEVYFLPRHARGHRLLPLEINHRANIYGFKKLGVDRIIGVSAVGSLREEYKPGDMLIADQFFDRTKASLRHTFFGNGLVAHIAFAHPVCEDLRQILLREARGVVAGNKDYENITIHDGGTYVNMEGPAFSTRAESNFYRSQGFDVIGMTCLAEAKLAREAEMCYAFLAMITDYDCWHDTEESVTAEIIIRQLLENVVFARDVVQRIIEKQPSGVDCSCHHALETALVTDRAYVPAKTREALHPIIGKYM